MFKLALLNVQRNFSRIKTMVLLLCITFAVLFVSNSILTQIDSHFENTYIDKISGHLVIAEQATENFTLFGADTLLVGDYLVPPVLQNMDELTELLDNNELVDSTAYMITSAAQLKTEGHQNKLIFFGVNFEQYIPFLNDFSLTSGRLPDADEHGIVLQDEQFAALKKGTKDFELGDMVLLTVAYDSSFTIREVPVLGTYSYGFSDTMVSKAALLDYQTAQDLNGYISAGDVIAIDDSEAELLGNDMDALFSGFEIDSETEDAGDDVFGFESLFEEDNTVEDDYAADSFEDSALDVLDMFNDAPENSSWNFILVRFKNAENYSEGIANVSATLSSKYDNLKINDWRNAVGGNILIVWFLKLLVNIGIWFIILGVSTITVNAIVLSIMERSKELSTMRALGASKVKVSELVFWETSFVVLGGALIGIIMGGFLVLLLNAVQIGVSNSFIQLLIGDSKLLGMLNIGIFIQHILFAFLLLIFSLIFPLRKILNIDPVQAMR